MKSFINGYIFLRNELAKVVLVQKFIELQQTSDKLNL